MKSFMKKSAAMVLLSASLVVSSLCPVQAEETGSVSGNDTAAGYSAESSTVSGSDQAVGCSAENCTVSGNVLAAGDSAENSTVSGGDAGGAVDSGGREAESTGTISDGGTGGVEYGEPYGDTDGVQDPVSPQDLTVYPDDWLMQWNMGNSSGKYGSSYDSYAVFDDNVIAALYGLGNDTYRLELTGTGEMAGPGNYDYQPYSAYRNKIISVTVGEGITNVGQKAFSRFSNLQEYTLPSSVKTIGEYAFEYCTSLKAVVIPDTVESISNYSFYHCEGTTSLTIPGDLDYNSLNIYAEYKKTGYSEKFREQHREEIEKHEAAKAAFDALGGQKIPKVADLTKEYSALLAEKNECYEEYKTARKEMIEYGTVKQNVDKILGLGPSVQNMERQQARGKKTEH